MTIDRLFDEVSRLPSAEKWLLVRRLLDDLEAEKQTTRREEWAAFVNRLYGALADDPIERPPQMPLTERDSID